MPGFAGRQGPGRPEAAAGLRPEVWAWPAGSPADVVQLARWRLAGAGTTPGLAIAAAPRRRTTRAAGLVLDAGYPMLGACEILARVAR